MRESVPKAVVTLHEIKRLWKQIRMSKISGASLLFLKVKEQKQKSGADVRRSNQRHSEGFHGVRQTGFVDHEQAPPHQRTHSAAHYAKLIDRKGRYGRFRHASSLPKTHALPRT
jgi:hypothetical protein